MCSPVGVVPAIEEVIDPLAGRFGGDHLTREPLDHLQAEGFVVRRPSARDWGSSSRSRLASHSDRRRSRRRQSRRVFASIPSPASSGFQFGPLEVHVYGLMYVLALAAAVLITARRWEAQGGSRGTIYEVAMWGFPAGLSAAASTST